MQPNEIHYNLPPVIVPDTDIEGFTHWLTTEAAEDSLIGAGFVWQRDVDSLIVIPLTTDVDSAIRRNLYLYLTTENDPELVGPPVPTRIHFFSDSLKTEINNKVGFAIYQYRFYDEYRTRRQRAEATQAVLGIIWNHEYYRNNILPDLTEEIVASPRQFGLDQYTFFGNYYHGVLILDAERDTIFSLGRVDLESKVMIWQNIFTGIINWNSPEYHPMKYCPGWSFMVQDRWDWDYISTDALKNVAYEAFPGIDKERDNDEDYNEPATAAVMLLVGLLQPLESHHLTQWTIALIAVFILFLMILSQITARNRQRDFIAHISHELRTPVSKVKLFAETLRNDRTVSEEKEDEYLDNILHASDHLSVLIDNTLNLARLDAGKFTVRPSTRNLEDWLGAFYKSHSGYLTEAGFESTLRVEPDLPEVSFDSEAMELVLRNILDNAVKFSEQHKEIEIIAERKDDKRVVLSVKDRGTGVPERKSKAVFRRFYRIRPKDQEPVGGAGLGLSIVKEIVKAHHGRVWCEGREGGGISFMIELPVA